jgi:hypothetical protein
MKIFSCRSFIAISIQLRLGFYKSKIYVLLSHSTLNNGVIKIIINSLNETYVRSMCVQNGKDYKEGEREKNNKRISDDLKLHRSSYIRLNEMQKKLSRQK